MDSQICLLNYNLSRISMLGPEVTSLKSMDRKQDGSAYRGKQDGVADKRETKMAAPDVDEGA